MTQINRRDLALLLALGLGGAATAAKAAPEKTLPPTHDMSGIAMPPVWTEPTSVAFLLYPGFTALDVVGPYHMLGNMMAVKLYLVAKTREPVVSDMGLTIVPNATFDEVPKELTVLFVGGGTTGTLAAMQDKETLAFLADRGARARYVTSTCTGSLVLGAAGLLRGYRATSHWIALASLADFGAIPVDKRVVTDRNRVTGAGVTAGMDMGLTLLGDIKGREYAELVQLLAEYAPEPPFNSGSTHTASPEARKMLEDMLASFVPQVQAIARAQKAG
jgi:transcriptional regulator GlxA family with amidase domain